MRGWAVRPPVAARTVAVALAAAVAALGAVAAEFPLKGLVLWCDAARDHEELREAISLEFQYVTPSSIVREANPDGSPRFDWKGLEKVLDDIASRGHQAILRFRYEYPGETTPEYPGKKGATGVPAYIKKRPDYHETFTANPGGDGPTYYADWSNPVLQDFTMRFFEAFAARYDSDRRLAFLEVGFGHWAEYHTHGTPVKLGRNFPSKEFQAKFMKMLAERMKLTPWCISIDAAQGKYSDMAKDKALCALPFGLFDDSFMHKDHDISQGEGWNEECWLAFGKDRWRRAPCGGEISYYSRRDQREFLNPKGLYGVTWEAAAAKYHMTFIIGNDSLDGHYATPRRIREATVACGYGLALKGVSREGDAVVAEIANRGVAPLYHEAFAAVRDAQRGDVVAEGSLRGIQPGESRRVKFLFPGRPSPEAVAERIEIVSPKLLEGATIPLDKAAAGAR